MRSAYSASKAPIKINNITERGGVFLTWTKLPILDRIHKAQRADTLANAERFGYVVSSNGRQSAARSSCLAWLGGEHSRKRGASNLGLA